MKIRTLTLIGIMAAAGALPGDEHGQWVSLFDGKTLKGWEQLNGTATYVVEDGTIVGRTTEGSPNSFLCSKKKYGDFILRQLERLGSSCDWRRICFTMDEGPSRGVRTVFKALTIAG